MLVVVFKELDCSSEGEMRLTTGCIDVTSTIKHLAGELIHRTVTLRTERHLNLIHILPNENRILDCTNLQWHIHDSLCIARLKIKSPEFV